jgi:hypothetical protein
LDGLTNAAPGARSMGSHQSASAITTTWLTPPSILAALGPFDLDPCAAPEPRPWPTAAVHWTREDNPPEQETRLQAWPSGAALHPIAIEPAAQFLASLEERQSQARVFNSGRRRGASQAFTALAGAIRRAYLPHVAGSASRLS